MGQSLANNMATTAPAAGTSLAEQREVAARLHAHNMAISLGGMPSHTLYPLSNFAIDQKQVQMEEDPSVDSRMKVTSSAG